MEQEKIYQVALSHIPGIGNITAKSLISYCGSATAIFKKNKHKLSVIPGIGTYIADSILNFKAFDIAEKEIEACEKQQVQILFYTDPEYPKRLKRNADAPVLLYFKGDPETLNRKKSVGIVGTRNATSYGKQIVDHLIDSLRTHDALIVSGLAYGIDIHAHKAALRNNLPTIGVMASGMDTIYPHAHRETAMKMLKTGGLITENKLTVKPDAHQFPARNRIIAGMSDAVIVVEAAKKGGALITAEIANSYNVDVFAVPGDIGKKYSEGCNNLIKQNKAHIITCIQDLEYHMNWDQASGPALTRKNIDYSQLNEDELSIVMTIEQHNTGILIDELSWKSQIPLNKLASSLLNLEIKGLVKPLPGKKYIIG